MEYFNFYTIYTIQWLSIFNRNPFHIKSHFQSVQFFFVDPKLIYKNYVNVLFTIEFIFDPVVQVEWYLKDILSDLLLNKCMY